MNNFISSARGRYTVGLVRYLFGPGSSEEHTNQRIIAAETALGYADGVRLDHVADAEQIYALGRDMDSHRVLLGVCPPGGWVWHCAISLPHEEVGRVSDVQWAHIARTAIHRLGFDSDDRLGRAPCRWIAVGHGLSAGGNDHIHLMVNLVREDGSLASTWNDRRTMSRLCAEMETLHGLAHVEGRAGRGMPGYSKVEHQRMKSGAELHRHRVARIVRSCALTAGSEAEFVRHARQNGLQVRPRLSKDQSTVTGYSIALVDEHGTTLWFGAGSRLAADLTLPRLREHWPTATPQATTEAIAEWRRTCDAAKDVVRDLPPATWRKAAARIERITAQLAATPHQDVAAWSTATRHSAAVAAALATFQEPRTPGPLTELADLLARAAQTSPGRPRLATRRGALADFRGIATVAMRAAKSPEWVLLLLALAALVHGIQAWQKATRPRLAAELEDALTHTRATYPPPSPRALAARYRSPSAPVPGKAPQLGIGTRPPTLRRDPGRDRGHGR